MNRNTPIRRHKPLDSRSELRRVAMPPRQAPMPRSRLASNSAPARKPIQAKPRRQPAHSPWPMSCPPGFYEEVMRRYGYSCARCGGRTGLTLSHRLAASRGGPFTHWNIEPLGMGPDSCDCHGWCEANPMDAEAEGWRVPGRIVRGEYLGPDPVYAETVRQALEAA